MQKKEENGILITLAPPGSMNLAAFFFNTRVIYRLPIDVGVSVGELLEYF